MPFPMNLPKSKKKFLIARVVITLALGMVRGPMIIGIKPKQRVPEVH